MKFHHFCSPGKIHYCPLEKNFPTRMHVCPAVIRSFIFI